jgi:eukaryotic-like serine/threonine-protein kinase
VGFEVGQRVADYEIVGLLGVGGMGRVYRVRNVISHRTEAMKVLLADLTAEPDLAARFVSEIRTLAGLDHPNIAQLHTALQVGNELVMIMEFVDGLTLQQLAQEGRLDPEKVINYAHQVLAALSFAHSRGVVHRDIKPANIMVTPQGTVKLTDFGIAKSRAKDELTRPGTTVGSLYYMSPEQARGGSAVDARADIYSVGINMYELLAGRRPFEDESAYVILHNQLNVAPRPPIEFNPLLSKPLNDLILKTLEKDPAKRFQSAAAVSDALREATGIAASTPIERAPFVALTGTVPVGCALPTTEAAATSRFSIDTHRRSWIAAEVLAVLTIPVLTAVGLPHFLKTTPIAKTAVHPIAQSSPLLAAPRVDVAATGSGRTEATTSDEPHMISTSDPAPVPAIGTAQRKAFSTAVSSSRHKRAAEPEPSRVKYQSASRPEMAPKAEGDEPAQPTTPLLSPPTAAEIQRLRDQRVGLETRAAAVRVNVQRLKSQREAAGEGLSQDVAAAYVRMNAYLGAEKSDLDDGDVAAARDHMEKAANEVNTLEALFSSGVPAVKQIAEKR